MEPPPREVILALLFRRREAAEELGPALWAALQEVEAFYNADEDRATFLRALLAPKIPARYREEPWHGKMNLGFDQIEAAVRDESEWVARRGRYSRTCDQEKLAAWARHLTGPHSRGRQLVLVTDQAITPPEGWRYVIWWETLWGEAKDYVVSSAPTDPKYWETHDPRRVATIKHRVRVACLSSVGAALGIGECENPSCYRCKPVDSVLDLDRMVYLGEEHDVPSLALRGFEPYPTDPPAGLAGAPRSAAPSWGLPPYPGEPTRRPTKARAKDPAEVQPVVSFPRDYGGPDAP